MNFWQVNTYLWHTIIWCAYIIHIYLYNMCSNASRHTQTWHFVHILQYMLMLYAHMVVVIIILIIISIIMVNVYYFIRFSGCYYDIVKIRLRKTFDLHVKTRRHKNYRRTINNLLCSAAPTTKMRPNIAPFTIHDYDIILFVERYNNCYD